MNTSFANQLVGFVLVNGTFESDSTASCHDGFAFQDGDVFMKVWMPRDGWFHLMVRVGSFDEHTSYYYSATNEVVSETTFISFEESVSVTTPNDQHDFDRRTIQQSYFQKSSF